MSPEVVLPYFVVRESLQTLVTVGGPLFLTVLIVGLAIGAVQSATQINDPAISFVPRMLALVGALMVSGHWIVETLAQLFRSSVERF